VLAVAVFVGLFATEAIAQDDDWVYRVRPGDNLWMLTDTHLRNLNYVERVQTLNQIADPYLVPPGTHLRIPLRWFRRQSSAARVVAAGGAGGAGTLLRANAGAAVPISVGLDIEIGDSLSCPAGSYAALEFADGSRLRVFSGSRIQLVAAWVYGNAAFYESEVALQHGRVESEVPAARRGTSRLRVQTPAATTSVRGTRFRVSADAVDSFSRSEVLRGRVGVSARARVVGVDAGFGTWIRAGAPPAPPVALLPAPDLSGLPPLLERTPLQFELAPLVGATGYRGQVATDARFNHLAADFHTTTTSLRGPDIPDGDYWLRVRGSDANGIEGVDAVRQFTLNARPEPPFALEPRTGAGTDIAPLFRWSEHPDADHYEFEVATDPGFATPLIRAQALREARYQVATALAPGHYFWRIGTVSREEGRGPMSSPMPFRVPHPGPTATAPPISRDALTITWSSSGPGQRFQFQLAADEQFADLRVDKQVDEPQVELRRPSGGRYFMRIRTIEADGFSGPFGKPQHIEVPASRWWLLVLTPMVLLL